MSDPVVSVVVPTRNRGHRIERTLATLRAQQVPTEIIVVDDASTDDSREHLRALAGDDVVVFHNDSRQGVSRTRNRGAAAARGRWVAFCDDDDLWHPHKLRAQLDALGDHEHAWSSVGEIVVDESMQVLDWKLTIDGPSLASALSHGNAIPGSASSVMVARSRFTRTGGFDPRFGHLADWDLWIRLSRHAPLFHVDDPLMLYVQSAAQMSTEAPDAAAEWARFRARHDEWRQRHGVGPGDAAHDFWLATVARRRHRHWRALRLYRRVVRQDADPELARFARHSIRTYLRSMVRPPRPPLAVTAAVSEIAAVIEG